MAFDMHIHDADYLRYLLGEPKSIKSTNVKEEGALNAMMSGSGPTVFGIFDDKQLARKAGQKIKELELTKQVYVVNVHNNRRK